MGFAVIGHVDRCDRLFNNFNFIFPAGQKHFGFKFKSLAECIHQISHEFCGNAAQTGLRVRHLDANRGLEYKFCQIIAETTFPWNIVSGKIPAAHDKRLRILFQHSDAGHNIDRQVLAVAVAGDRADPGRVFIQEEIERGFQRPAFSQIYIMPENLYIFQLGQFGKYRTAFGAAAVIDN